MVTVPARADLNVSRRQDLPALVGADDAKRAAWVRADTYAALLADLDASYHGQVFTAHRGLLAELLDTVNPTLRPHGSPHHA
ncbi:hypothetical protein Acor_83430 [Acrocarpospora corrugata]|uniref:Uncharacterized protein n=2 Tax=Acrocarpospora corrugata TaxID=35763 RepID=A0A5M3WBE9_9ACTN|nr:hypothetical protein Acor_83430 [Acrocarpospora corrugata]